LTKWIHLNHLDTGLIAFFRKCHRHLKSGGRFVLEKQGWKGYKDAKRGSEVRSRRVFDDKRRYG
jgi:7SK snRNA methylphosphate capping enzyme